MATLAQQVNEAVNREIGKVVGRLASNIVSELVASTPVETGHARSNWIPSVGFPFDGVVGSRESVDFSVQLSALSQLSTYSLDKGNIYITNSVSYIEDLNRGTSPEAQAGYVESVVERAVAGLS